MEEYTYSSLLPEAIRGRNQQGVKNTKRSMLISGLCLLLTAVMLMGSTFAWFTDSVTNEGNKIEAGTLDISYPLKTKAPGSALTEPLPCWTAMWGCMNTITNTPAPYKGVLA